MSMWLVRISAVAVAAASTLAAVSLAGDGHLMGSIVGACIAVVAVAVAAAVAED